MLDYKKVEVNGIQFNLGYQSDREFSGPVFEIYRGTKKYAALGVKAAGDEISWGEGLTATEEEAKACVAARQWMNENLGFNFKY